MLAYTHITQRVSPLGHCSLGLDICGVNTKQPLPLYLYAYAHCVTTGPYHNIDRYCKRMGVKITVNDPVTFVLAVATRKSKPVLFTLFHY